MESPYERPDLSALEDLDRLLNHAMEELAGWRRRCLRAEGELQNVKTRGGVYAGPDLQQARQRVVELENENQVLRQRVEAARDRLNVLANRLSFLEQDIGSGAT